VVNWQEMLKDKRFLAAAAAVGVIGLVVFMRKKSSGADGSDGNDPPVATGTFDTSGTDMASWVSEMLKNHMAAIAAGQNQPGGATTPNTPTTEPRVFVPVPRVPTLIGNGNTPPRTLPTRTLPRTPRVVG
jgi:hypothetical protein